MKRNSGLSLRLNSRLYMESKPVLSKAKAESDKGNRSEQIYFDINAKDEYCFASEADVMLLRTGFNLHELIDIPSTTQKSETGVRCKKCQQLGIEDGVSMLRCEAKSCRAVYHKKCIESAVREVMAKHKNLKRFDISCPHCALVEQEMAASIGKNFRFLYRQNPPDNLDCATVKLKLIPNLNAREVETVHQILSGTLPSYWTMEQQCKFLKDRIARR